MSPSGSETALWRETNPRFSAAPQHLEMYPTALFVFRVHHVSLKEFEHRNADLPVRQNRLPVNSKQMWGDVKMLCEAFDSLSELWLCGGGTPECPCFTHLFFLMVKRLIFHVVTEMMVFLSTWCHGPHLSTGTPLDPFSFKVSIILDHFRIVWTGLNKPVLILYIVLHQKRREERHPMVKTWSWRHIFTETTISKVDLQVSTNHVVMFLSKLIKSVFKSTFFSHETCCRQPVSGVGVWLHLNKTKERKVHGCAPSYAPTLDIC